MISSVYAQVFIRLSVVIVPYPDLTSTITELFYKVVYQKISRLRLTQNVSVFFAE